MSDLECGTIVKFMDFRIFRMSDLKCRKNIKIIDFWIFRISDLKCREHLKRIRVNQKATTRTTFGCFFYRFDNLSTFQIGHPENPEIHHFDNFSTSPIGHPEIPKIHHFTILAISRISRSLTGRDNTSLACENVYMK